jgi:hypothetical protein
MEERGGRGKAEGRTLRGTTGMTNNLVVRRGKQRSFTTGLRPCAQDDPVSGARGLSPVSLCHRSKEKAPLTKVGLSLGARVGEDAPRAESESVPSVQGLKSGAEILARIQANA